MRRWWCRFWFDLTLWPAVAVLCFLPPAIDGGTVAGWCRFGAALFMAASIIARSWAVAKYRDSAAASLEALRLVLRAAEVGRDFEPGKKSAVNGEGK